MMRESDVFVLCDRVRETAFALHKYLRHGHLERVYENGMVHRLRKQQIEVEPLFTLTVLDENGTVLGDYAADLFIERTLIVELKACRTIDDATSHNSSAIFAAAASNTVSSSTLAPPNSKSRSMSSLMYCPRFSG